MDRVQVLTADEDDLRVGLDDAVKVHDVLLLAIVGKRQVPNLYGKCSLGRRLGRGEVCRVFALLLFLNHV